MSTFWSVWIIVITLACIFACLWLLARCMKNHTSVDEGQSMGHEFDGIEELNNAPPKWWSYMFIATIVFALLYLLAYPGLGNWQGLLNWRSADKDIRQAANLKQTSDDANSNNQYLRELNAANARFGEVFRQLAFNDDQTLKPITELAQSREALNIGQRLYLQNCAQCHGYNARGAVGYPNLSDNDWLYGGEPEQIKASILHGRMAQMPPWEGVLGDEGIVDMTNYVLSLSGRKVNERSAARGQEKFNLCVACHGANGQGLTQFGAPNLSDNIWLYGGSKDAVEYSLRYGRQGLMPAFENILGEEKIHLISAYIYRLSQTTQKASE